jgi:hypothetical protein
MLRKIFIVIFSFANTHIYSQFAVEVAADSALTTANYIQSAIDRAEQISQGIQTLLLMNQTLQYQVQALQKLSEGSWDSFVEFFAFQTAAIGAFAQTATEFNDLFGGYDELVMDAGNLSKATDAANKLVRSTDNLMKMTEMTSKIIQQGVRESANAAGPLEALQAHAKILNGIASEASATTQLLYSMQKYDQVLRENEKRNSLAARKLASKFFEKPNPDPFRRGKASDRIRDGFDGRYLDGTKGLEYGFR